MERNVDRIVWVCLMLLGYHFFFFSRRVLLVCFCYMLLTNTVKLHLEKLFCVPEGPGEELSD